ncbi:MAG: Transposase IS66 family protein [Syntrophaceae bacterium PtaB.Bin038]|nr:MAG: Transposase IS66 family protein [Syntrophaceae bacterium PtaB.Bin038]
MGNLRRIKRASQSPHPWPALPADGGSQRLELDRSELEAILERAKTALSEEEYTKLRAAIETLVFLTQELEKKHVSLQRLKQLLFGATTETTRKVIERILDDTSKERSSGDEAAGGKEPEAREKAPGHGRNGAEEYVGAQKVRVPHESLNPGDACPNCKKGTVYESVEPGHLVRIKGQAPLGATVYELQKLRCNLCGEIFTARTPPGVGPDKYDAESASMIALLKYGSGLPFNRLQRLEGSLGIPLPAATQWEIVEHSADVIAPAQDELIRQAAQGHVLHNDDTTMKVLALARPSQEPNGSEGSDRKGVFTSGLVSILAGHRVALFFTGHRHAGENLATVLKQRACELSRPLQMCDALSRNLPDLPEELQTIVAHCLAHARRQFVDVAGNFPEECLYVLQILKVVYTNDALAKDSGMSPEQRLKFHQANSGPKMDELKAWLTAQFEERKVEPNSGLGEAITYMLKYWEQLTLFLHEPAAPLDNNVCEQALKKAILHRKNAYFYKTENGARVGDLFMSLIHTCELNGANPFDYLTALQKHADELRAHPADWMPWNYRDTLARQVASQPI